MRDSTAAETSKQTVITIHRAMRRAGFLRERDEAKNWGAVRKRKPRSADAGPVYPASTSGAGNWASSSSFVARLKALCWSTRA
jgi:hypothetical protein